MVKNNFEKDIKMKCLEEGLTQQQVAEKIGTTGQYVSRVIKKKDGLINNTFVQIMNALGYDIVVSYEKKET